MAELTNSYVQGNVVMGIEDESDISLYRNLHLQSLRNLHITIEVLDKEDNTVETIEGFATGGSLAISRTSLIRRTGSVNVVLMDMFKPKKDSLFWMTNKIRLYAGIEDLSTENRVVTNFCLGTFHISEPQVSEANGDSSIAIELMDYMSKWEMEIENKIVFSPDTPLHTAVQYLMNFVGETNTSIEFTDLLIPYTLEFEQGSQVVSILEALRDLYMDWECYYDVSGKFHFKQTMFQKKGGEPTVWSFTDKSQHSLSVAKSYTYRGVKNKVVVIGETNAKTGITPRAESSISTLESPFHENEIGIQQRVIVESTYSNTAQCQARSRYELFKLSNMQETAEITSIPIYFLEAGDIIEIKSDINQGMMDEYMVDDIGIDLSTEGTMTISAHKLYYDDYSVDTKLEEYRRQADVVIQGITNYGWLHLAEQRVEEYYGLRGDGSPLMVRFESDARYGTTAYVTNYASTKLQTLTIDLADFGVAIGENGDLDAGKAEFADRILGHEMVHAIQNNAFGAIKSIYMPEWFKEGSAELLHGADERLKNSIVTNGLIDDVKMNALVLRAVNLMTTKTWEGISDDYSASYLILKYLDKKVVAGKNMKNVMADIKNSTKSGEESIKDSIISNTAFTSFEEFTTGFQGEITHMVKNVFRLNLTGDELDTGSIAGIDHRGTISLTAEKIFDNSFAQKGLLSHGFNVTFDRP